MEVVVPAAADDCGIVAPVSRKCQRWQESSEEPTGEFRRANGFSSSAIYAKISSDKCVPMLLVDRALLDSCKPQSCKLDILLSQKISDFFDAVTLVP
jgi:hypothetical protein